MTFRSEDRVRRFVSLASFAVMCSLPLNAQNDVLTWHNDNARTGQNTGEAILTPANVNVANFGLLAKVTVDGKVDAQPLYVSELGVQGKGKHNVLFVATEHDSLYAIDADNGGVLWQRSLLGAGETTSDARSCDQVTPEIGVTATPAISRTVGPNGTIYVVAMSKDAAGNYFHRIHAIDLSTGAEEFNGPVVVRATYPGTGDGSSNGTVTFDPKQYKDRPGLLLLNGNLYTSWGSHCDLRPYAGWMMTYDQTTLAQTGVLDFVPNGNSAAPWNAGAGPAGDAAGSVFISLGNGTFDSTLTPQGFPNRGDYGNALVKLDLTRGGLVPTDYWTMYNSNAESNVDADLGSGGLMLLPDEVDSSGITRHLAVAAGKDHNIYVADRDNMGKFDANSNGTLYQELTGALPGGAWSSPAFFNGHVYYGSVGQNLRSFAVSGARLVGSPVQTTLTSFGYPGTTPSVSGYNTTGGIVWATEYSSPAVLHAYDANDLSRELYNSSQAANRRDQFGAGNKFITPTIANGKVFVGTQNSVGIFGFRRGTPPPLPDGDYLILNNLSKLVIDDPRASTAPGTAMIQWKGHGGPNQEWFFSYDGKGYYTIQNVGSKLFLTDTNGDATPGIASRQSTPTHDATQLWSLSGTSSGFVIQNKATGLVVDDGGSSLNQGASVILSAPSAGANQRWTMR